MAANNVVAATARSLKSLVVAALSVLSALSPAAGAEKTFVYAVAREPDSLDSAKTTRELSMYFTWLLYDSLLNISKDGKGLEAGVAESWTTAPDGLEALFTLRSGVVLHDGTPLDARVVKASFERQFRAEHPLYHSDPPNGKETLLRELIDDIQVRDPLRIAFKLKYPGLHYLSQIDVVSPSAAATLGKEFGRSPVGSGPFKFESWSKDRMVFVANAKYWGGRPKIDRVVFRFIPETKAMVEALLNEQAHFSPTSREAVFFERLRENPRVRLVAVPALNTYYLGFYADRAPFNNLLLRRAVVRAINVPRTALFLGRGAAIAAKGPLAPAMKGYDATVSQPSYDPQEARELLVKSGHGGGLAVSILYNLTTWESELAGAIQNDLRRIGITVQLSGKQSEFFPALKARVGDMFLYSWAIRAPYPERLLVPLFHSRAAEATNITRYRNPDVDRLLDNAIRLPDGVAQDRLYSELQRLIVEDAPMAFLHHATKMAVVSTRVHGLELNLGMLPYDKLVKVDLGP